MSSANVIRGKRVLITGGAGMIGSALADQLVEAGVGEIVVLDNFARGRMDNLAWAAEHGNVTVIEGDIRDEGTLARAMDGVDTAFHMAAIRINQCAIEHRLAVEVLGMGSFNVYEAAAAAGVRKVVTSSTASVYGLAETFPTTEDHHPYANDTLYGAAKAFNEGMLRAIHADKGLDYVALRYFNVYGPRIDTHGKYTEVLVRWMQRIDEGLAPLINGDGTTTMDFVEVSDVARANVLAALSDTTDEAFNVASGVETSLLELAYALLNVMGSDLEPELGPQRTVNKVSRRLADTSKARDILGFEAQVSLEEGLVRLVDWYRAARAAGTAPMVKAA
jgi:UDP-glucose 4-epimerase